MVRTRSDGEQPFKAATKALSLRGSFHFVNDADSRATRPQLVLLSEEPCSGWRASGPEGKILAKVKRTWTGPSPSSLVLPDAGFSHMTFLSASAIVGDLNKLNSMS